MNTTFIDTIGFHDTDDENEQKLQLVLFLKEIRHGFDISNLVFVILSMSFVIHDKLFILVFYCVRMDVFTSDQSNLFAEIYSKHR
jgi:hypothetical protein